MVSSRRRPSFSHFLRLAKTSSKPFPYSSKTIDYILLSFEGCNVCGKEEDVPQLGIHGVRQEGHAVGKLQADHVRLLRQNIRRQHFSFYLAVLDGALRGTHPYVEMWSGSFRGSLAYGAMRTSFRASSRTSSMTLRACVSFLLTLPRFSTWYETTRSCSMPFVSLARQHRSSTVRCALAAPGWCSTVWSRHRVPASAMRI